MRCDSTQYPYHDVSTIKDTLSPTAMGLVLLFPFILKLPLSLQSYACPSAQSTLYQLPVVFITKPSTMLVVSLYYYFNLSGFSVMKLAHDFVLAFLGLPTTVTSGMSFCKK